MDSMHVQVDTLAIPLTVLEEAALAVVSLSGCVKAQVAFALTPMEPILVSGDPSASFPGALHAGLIMASAGLSGETEAMGVGMEMTVAATEEEEMELRVEPGATVAVGACPMGHRLLMIAQTIEVVAGGKLASKIAPLAVTVGFATSEGTGS
mmetsp:Transcript_19740/g.29946  ORF Transcript_19740/g.29946 Transcript_19740/m.29946 type:complete len:152 (+) Transcript_19740:1436-1891(+)